MIRVPIAVIARPYQTARAGRSPSTGPDARATNSGAVVTSTTEVTIDVSLTDSIQNAKCSARQTPASSVRAARSPVRGATFSRL